jgi:hypothetical protein
MRLVLLAVLALAWGGCQTAQAARAQADDRECQGMGYKPLGTEMYLQCRQILQQRTQAQATKVQRALDNLSRPVTCTTFGDTTTCRSD